MNILKAAGYTEINRVWQRNMMAIKFVKMDVSCFAGAELAAVDIAFYRWVTMIDSYVIWYRVVSAINFFAHCTHKAILYLFDVLFIPTPSWSKIRHYTAFSLRTTLIYRFFVTPSVMINLITKSSNWKDRER